MSVTVLYFAALRERLGKSSETASLHDAATVGEWIAAQGRIDPALADAFAGPGAIRVAVNKTLADLHAPLNDGDELALFPPMTGG